MIQDKEATIKRKRIEKLLKFLCIKSLENCKIIKLKPPTIKKTITWILEGPPNKGIYQVLKSNTWLRVTPNNCDTFDVS